MEKKKKHKKTFWILQKNILFPREFVNYGQTVTESFTILT